MPYIKRKEDPFAAVRRLLLGYGLRPTVLAEVLRCSPPTARKKIANPALLTLEDLHKIERYGHVPAAEIRQAIMF